MNQRDIIVDPEFRQLIPPLTPDERAQLEANLLADGCRDALVVWAGENILLDGHNRLDICQAHGIDLEFVELELADRDAAMLWIEENQLGRRNLTLDQLTAVAFSVQVRRTEAAKRERAAKARLCGGKATEEQIADRLSVTLSDKRSDQKQDTRAAVAKKYGIPERKLRAIQEISKHSPDAVADIRDGKKTIKEAIGEIKLAGAKERYAESRKHGTPPNIVRADAIEWLSAQGQCDLLLTDPPYSTDVENMSEFVKWLPFALERVKPTGRAYVFVGAYPEELRLYLNEALPDQVLVWTYRNTLGPSAAKQYNLNWQAILYYCLDDAVSLDCPQLSEQWAVQDVAAPDGRIGNRIHKWQKPDILAERLIMHSTKPGDVVFDPFAGSGTFLYAAGRLGRFGFGCDIAWEE